MKDNDQGHIEQEKNQGGINKNISQDKDIIRKEIWVTAYAIYA